jgi:hypothetical protein
MTASPARGDLRIISPPDGGLGARLCLVLNVHHAPQPFAEVALIHTSQEFATDHDVYVPQALCGTPHPVVVQTDLRGVVWPGQVSGDRVGLICDAGLAAASGLVASGASDPVRLDSAVMHIGRPLGLPLLDGRWAFKRDEGKALDRLTSGCTSSLLNAVYG